MIVAESVALSQSTNAPDVTTAIIPAVTPAATPLLSLGLISVVASRGRIRVMVFIGEGQARVSSSSEGCLTLQKTVKVVAYQPSILALRYCSQVCGSISVYQRSCCQSFYCSKCYQTTVAWIVQNRRLKRQNLGNGFHW